MFCSMFRDVLFVNLIPFGAFLMKKKNVKKNRDYLQISYAHDSRHFDFRGNSLLIMCSVYLNRGLTIYFIVFKGFP